MDEALVQDAEHDVNGDQRGQNEIRLVLERVLEGLRGSLEAGVDGRGHAQLTLGFFQSCDGVAQGHVGRQVEGERNRRVLALVIDLQVGSPVLIMSDGRQRHHRAARGSGWSGNRWRSAHGSGCGSR